MKYRLLITIFISIIFTLPECLGQNPVPPVPLPPAEEEVFKVVEEMPRFPGCEFIDGSPKKKETCAKEKMLEYIYSNLEYPKLALKNEVEGMAVVQFIIEKNGSITGIRTVRNPGAGTGEEAARIVSAMNDMAEKWRSGYQRGVPVRVQYTLPVKFKIEGKKEQSRYNNYETDVVYVDNLDEAPLFPDCPKRKNSDCTIESLQDFIKENQIYPESAFTSRTEGIVNITFIIEEDGSISDIKAYGNGTKAMKDDAIDIFKWMNHEEMEWTPGKKNNRVVRTKYKCDVAYDIEDWESRN